MRKVFFVITVTVLLAGCREPFAEVGVPVTAKNSSLTDTVIPVVEGISYERLAPGGTARFEARVPVARNPVNVYGGGYSTGPSIVDKSTDISVFFRILRADGREELSTSSACVAGAKVRIEITYFGGRAECRPLFSTPDGGLVGLE